ncbi:MAG: response regulator [Patescibacteria group bacterium]
METTKKSILIIEDETPLMEALTDKIEQAGFTVVQAKNGDDGLTQALENKPDLILLDILLPKKDGLQVLTELRQNVWGKTAKVIMLTNVDDWTHTKKAVALDVQDYLVKSNMKLTEIVKVIHNKLSK